MWHVSCHFAKHLTDVQTDVHIVPIDSDAENCNLLILPTTGGALALYIGTITSPGHHTHTVFEAMPGISCVLAFVKDTDLVYPVA